MSARNERLVLGSALVVGAALLWGTFHTTRGSATFWLVGFALAAVWLAAAAVTSGGMPAAGRVDAVTAAIAVGLGAAAFVAFYVAYRIVRDVALFEGALDRVAVTAGSANVVALVVLTVVTGVAEEVFFRGALWEAIGPTSDRTDVGDGRTTSVVSAALYALVTAASLNVALVIAAAVMGAVWSAVRQWSGGFVAPALCHVTWSAAMLLAIQ